MRATLKRAQRLGRRRGGQLRGLGHVCGWPEARAGRAPVEREPSTGVLGRQANVRLFQLWCEEAPHPLGTVQCGLLGERGLWSGCADVASRQQARVPKGRTPERTFDTPD